MTGCCVDFISVKISTTNGNLSSIRPIVTRCSVIISPLTHWGRVTHICVGTLTIIGSDNGLSPSRRQAIIWTNAGLLSIGPLGKNFNQISIKFLSFSFKKLRLKVSSAKWRPFCLGLNVLRYLYSKDFIHCLQTSELSNDDQRKFAKLSA